jgi:hypothetical protein
MYSKLFTLPADFDAKMIERYLPGYLKDRIKSTEVTGEVRQSTRLMSPEPCFSTVFKLLPLSLRPYSRWCGVASGTLAA